jgi:hypothetical protein
MSEVTQPDTIIDFLDELIFTETGQRLDCLQKTILEGSLNGQKYQEIAENSNFHDSYIREVGSNLWKILSDVLERKVTKKNIKIALKESKYNNVFGGDFIALNNVNICNHNLSPPPNNNHSQSETEKNQTHLDLYLAPEITQFYGRKTELETLETWIVNNQYKLVTILGLKEIGKTHLYLKLIEQIQDNFNHIISRSLDFCPTLDELLSDILQSMNSQLKLPNSIEKKINLLLDFMKNNRCLIILDDLQNLFDAHQLAGIYKESHKDYQILFKRIAEAHHQTCLLLISQMKPIDTTFVKLENKTLKILTLQGLKEEATAILENYNLSNSDSWITLIKLYQGHPLWLELTAHFIQEFFKGNVEEFLQLKTPLFEDTLQQILSEMIQSLTEAEKTMITELASLDHSVSLPDIINQSSLSPTDSLKVINALIRRILVTKENNLLSLNPIFKTYVTNYSVSKSFVNK